MTITNHRRLGNDTEQAADTRCQYPGQGSPKKVTRVAPMNIDAPRLLQQLHPT
ncbi:hypothetical protein [Reinekea sp. G2M2-21]|uniref:hypothetical protein n=1 Tax=Reinekea sp. G2M2-21 TaxID=2788942 RepID=UPI0018A9C144|nr:hypothetical protein [Reinekea sp. G2M2-21]